MWVNGCFFENVTDTVGYLCRCFFILPTALSPLWCSMFLIELSPPLVIGKQMAEFGATVRVPL